MLVYDKIVRFFKANPTATPIEAEKNGYSLTYSREIRAEMVRLGILKPYTRHKRTVLPYRREKQQKIEPNGKVYHCLKCNRPWGDKYNRICPACKERNERIMAAW